MLRHLVRVQRVMVRLPRKHGPVVKLLAGKKFLAGGMCLPNGKLLPAVMCHPLPTVRHTVFCPRVIGLAVLWHAGSFFSIWRVRRFTE